MKKSYIPVVLFALFIFSSAFKKDEPKPWTVSYDKQKVFIENLGQFHIASQPQSKVKYAYDGGSTMLYFTSTGITYSFLKTWKKEEKEDGKEKKEREYEAIKKGKSHQEMEREEGKLNYSVDVISMLFENSNPNAEIIAEESTPDYYSYTFKDFNNHYKEKNINFIKAFKKITYKNIYPNIDIEYTFHPEEGIKYKVILHPGADASQIKMNYDSRVKLNAVGDALIDTRFGDIIDHAPTTFYDNNKSEIITSHFIKDKKTISFELGNYDHSKTVVIDPWLVTPNFATNWKCVWEVEKDGAGNAYCIGGVAPMALVKYNAAGTLQWTYNTPYDTSQWLGTFATDLAGNSYVTQGTQQEILKVNAAGGLVWSNTNPGGTGATPEFWVISFNCDQTKLIVAGTGGFVTPYIYTINTTNGNVMTGVQVAPAGNAFISPQETRALTPSKNGRYYFLSHANIGYIDQNVSLCPTTGGALPSVYTSSGYNLSYKCENFRVNNCGIMAIRANGNFVYTQNGANVQKRSLSNFAILATAAIPGGTFTGGQVSNSGIDIDSCGNVYVGSTNAVIKYDANLNQLMSSPTTFPVYDVAVSYGGNIIVGGTTGNSGTAGVRTGKMQQINMGACNPIIQFCCDATICNHPNVCVNAAPFNFTSATAGGTWSGVGITNASAGTFNPAVAGPGTHTIVYTLACGADSTTIIVSPCVALTVCTNANGSLTVSNGVSPYTWQYYTPASTVTVNSQATCTACGGTWLFGSCLGVSSCTTPAYWTTFATGPSSGTLPASFPTQPIQVIDASGTKDSIASLALIPSCSACPTLTVTISNQVNVACAGQSTGSFSAATTGGASPYNYTLMNGATTVATFTGIAGIQNFTALPAGTYTLNVVDANACPGTATITITPGTATSATVGPKQTVCATTATLSGNTPTVGTGTWTLVSGAGTITTPSSPTSGVTALGVGPNVFQWTVSNPPCPNTTALDTITGVAPPTVAAAGPNQSICVTTTNLAGNAPIVGTGTWTLVSGTGTITSPTLPNSGITGLGVGANVFQWTISNPICPPSTSQVTITSTGGAGAANAGPNQSLCGTTTATMAANNPAPGTGTWTLVSGTGTITTPSSPTTGISGLGNGVNVFAWTITNPPCPSTTSNDTITVAVPPTVAVAGPNQTICSSSTILAGNVAAIGTGTWTLVSGTGTINNPNSPTSGVSGLGLGANVFAWTIANPPCPPTTSQVTITSTGNATTNITAQTNILCFGGTNGSATANTTGGVAPYNYVWTGTAGTLQTHNGISTPDSLTGLAAGTYTVTVTDNTGCVIAQTVTITQPAQLTISVVNSANATCGNNNGTATIAATGGTIGSGYIYSWTPSGGTAANATGLGANTYTITATDANACTATTTVAITNSTSPVISIASQTNVLCNGGNTGAATTSVVGGTTPLTYSWSGGAGTSANASNLAAGTYTVTVTDSSSCTSNTSVTITQPSAIIASVATTSTTCAGPSGTATVSASGGTGTLNYSWSGGGATSTTINNLPVGTYTVSVSDANSCTVTATGTVVTTGTPVANAGAGAVILQGGTATLNGSGNGVSHVWTPPTTLTCDTCFITVASPIQTTTYTLTVTDSNGCKATDTVTVFVEIPCPTDKDLVVPNAFSPNGDGYNDEFCLQGWNYCITQFQIMIFDRWGEKVFQSSDSGFCWDGTYNGRKLDPAVFVYFITATLGNNEGIKKKGNISLIR